MIIIFINNNNDCINNYYFINNNTINAFIKINVFIINNNDFSVEVNFWCSHSLKQLNQPKCSA